MPFAITANFYALPRCNTDDSLHHIHSMSGILNVDVDVPICRMDLAWWTWSSLYLVPTWSSNCRWVCTPKDMLIPLGAASRRKVQWSSVLFWRRLHIIIIRFSFTRSPQSVSVRVLTKILFLVYHILLFTGSNKYYLILPELVSVSMLCIICWCCTSIPQLCPRVCLIMVHLRTNKCDVDWLLWMS